MKNTFKLLGIIALAAIIVFAMAACGDRGSGEDPTHTHSYSGWTTKTLATCTEAEVEKRTCVCGEEDTRNSTINLALGHEGVGAIPATCTTVGYSGTGTCIRCPETVTGTEIPALGHDSGTWHTTLNSTCIDVGTKELRCTIDNVVLDTGTIAALGHAASGAIPATCIAVGYSGTGTCIRCPETVTGTEIPALGHDSGVWHTTLAATCTAAGTKELRCTIDNVVLDTGTIAALGHDTTGTAATCTTAKICARTGCDHVLETELGHLSNSWNWSTYNASTGQVSCTRSGCGGGFASSGDTGPAGGIIFYVSTAGFTVDASPSETPAEKIWSAYNAYYLEAAPANESNSQWGALGATLDVITFATIPTAAELIIGNGRKDTWVIVNYLGTNETDRAAQRCVSRTETVGGIVYNDWFLPSLGELDELYNLYYSKEKGSYGGLSTALFWSSSQHSMDRAWYQNFQFGNQGANGSKAAEYAVRAIRAF